MNSTFNFTSVADINYWDVPANAWYAPVIAKAKAAGYISGYTDGSIHPQSNITRQEAAVIISKLKNLTATSNMLNFTDASSIANWSKQAVIAAFEAKIMSGYPDGSFQPNAPIKRAEALVAVKNCFNYEAAVDTVPDNTVINNPSSDVVYDKAGAYSLVVTLSNQVNSDVVISISEIAGVTAPVTGATAVTAVTDTAQYTGTVSWNPAHSIFTGTTSYTASITLSPKVGYTLTGVTENFFPVAGATSVNNVAGAGIVTAVFPATAQETVTSVAIKTAPTKTTYTAGEVLDLSGLVVTLTYNDTTTGDIGLAEFVSHNITTVKANGEY